MTIHRHLCRAGTLRGHQRQRAATQSPKRRSRQSPRGHTGEQPAYGHVCVGGTLTLRVLAATHRCGCLRSGPWRWRRGSTPHHRRGFCTRARWGLRQHHLCPGARGGLCGAHSPEAYHECRSVCARAGWGERRQRWRGIRAGARRRHVRARPWWRDHRGRRRQRGRDRAAAPRAYRTVA